MQICLSVEKWKSVKTDCAKHKWASRSDDFCRLRAERKTILVISFTRKSFNHRAGFSSVIAACTRRLHEMGEDSRKICMDESRAKLFWLNRRQLATKRAMAIKIWKPCQPVNKVILWVEKDERTHLVTLLLLLSLMSSLNHSMVTMLIKSETITQFNHSL